MSDPAEDHPWLEFTLDNAFAFLMKAIEGGIAHPDTMTREERKKHNPGMPIVTMNAAERAWLLEQGEWLRKSLRLLQGILVQVPDDYRTYAEYRLADVLISAFNIGRGSQYNLAERRQAQETSKAQAKKMRDAKLTKEEVQIIVAKCLDAFLKENPQHSGRKLGDLIAPSVNLNLGYELKPDTIARHIREIKKRTA
jgi:hypothetical protein